MSKDKELQKKIKEERQKLKLKGTPFPYYKDAVNLLLEWSTGKTTKERDDIAAAAAVLLEYEQRRTVIKKAPRMDLEQVLQGPAPRVTSLAHPWGANLQI